MSKRKISVYLRSALCVMTAVCLIASSAIFAFKAYAAVYTTSSLVDGGTLTLTEDSSINLNGFQVQQNREYTIDLNGHDLDVTSYFMMMGGTVNLKDSAGGGTLYVNGSNSNSLAWFYGGGTFNFLSGTIDGSKVSGNGPQRGGAFCIEGNNQQNVSSVVNMYGGTIQNFKVSQNGGAVYVGGVIKGGSSQTNQFNMYAGTIKGCYAGYQGGAIYVDNSNPIMGQCNLIGDTLITITGNTANGDANGDGYKDGNAIYNNGQLNIRGYLKIDGSVFLNNEWNGSGVNRYIRVVGPLCVVGTGFINVDTTYWRSGYEAPATHHDGKGGGSGYTVVENAGGIDPEIFYTYATYFYNVNHSLGVTDGYKPGTNTSSWGAANHDLDYEDIFGVMWRVTTTDSQGIPRQSSGYLIYAENLDGNRRYYHSIKLRKEDGKDHTRLSGAQFVLEQLVEGDWIPLATQQTGIANTDEDGITYFFDGSNVTSHKLMLFDGEYRIRELQAPATYNPIPANEQFYITITVNGSNVEIDSSDRYFEVSDYGMGEGTAHEIVFTAKNYKDIPKGYAITGIKYGESYAAGHELGGAQFAISDSSDTVLDTASSIADGTFSLEGDYNSGYFEYDKTYILSETSSPNGYKTISDVSITVSKDNSDNITVTLSPSSNASYSVTAVTDEDEYDNILELIIIDEPNEALPSTGGAGVFPILMAGMLIMCVSAAVFVLRRRCGERAENK